MTLAELLPGWPKFCRLRTGKYHISATKGKTLCGFDARSFDDGDEMSSSSICEVCRRIGRESGLTTYEPGNDMTRLRVKGYVTPT